MEVETERDFTGDRVQHLEMIQGVIARMANSSALMKRLAIVVVGGAATLAVRRNSGASVLPALAVALTVIFWLMDARFRVYYWIYDRGYDNFSFRAQAAARQAQR